MFTTNSRGRPIACHMLHLSQVGSFSRYFGFRGIWTVPNVANIYISGVRSYAPERTDILHVWYTHSPQFACRHKWLHMYSWVKKYAFICLYFEKDNGVANRQICRVRVNQKMNRAYLWSPEELIENSAGKQTQRKISTGSTGLLLK